MKKEIKIVGYKVFELTGKLLKSFYYFPFRKEKPNSNWQSFISTKEIWVEIMFYKDQMKGNTCGRDTSFVTSSTFFST